VLFRRSGGILAMFLFIVGIVFPVSPSFGADRECRSREISGPLTSAESRPEIVLEEELLALTNQQRANQGLPILTPDTALIRIARDQSQGMAQQGFISHEQPSGDLQTRMHRAGYLYDVVRENVASARTVTIAQNLLLDSPPHKSNILAADVARVGIGIVRYKPPFDKQLYITEIFAGPLEENQPGAVKELALRRVNELRGQSGSGLVQPDPLLENLATRSVASLQVPVKREDIRRLLATSVGELQNEGRLELSRLDAAVQLLHNPHNLSIPEEAREKKAGAFATAVRQITDSQNQTAFLVLTLIGFTR
jgi:hypothetical protein